ncbi:unnamed protein product [Sphagnum tenellum]
MFLKNAHEKASQGAQLSKTYLQDVGDSIFGHCDLNCANYDGDWHQLCVDRHRREGCCGFIDIPSRRCRSAHKPEEATNLAIDQVQAAHDTTIQIGQLAYNIPVERSAHAYDYATSTVKIATTAKDATLRTAFDNFNVVADKAMVAKDTTMVEVVADACRLAADKATTTKATSLQAGQSAYQIAVDTITQAYNYATGSVVVEKAMIAMDTIVQVEANSYTLVANKAAAAGEAAVQSEQFA